MFRFLKGIIKGGEAPGIPAILRIGEIHEWIQCEEGKVREELGTLVAIHRERITRATSRIDEILAGFDAAEIEEVTHRKLAGVTERSMPLFLKAMRMSLSRELPSDPEGFYTATGEILRGCLSAFRGQGRYLGSRFPAEMKALRDGVDTIGREANTMTPGIAKARERFQALRGLREVLDGYLAAKGRAALAGEEVQALETAVGQSRASLESVQRALTDLGKSEEFQACEQDLARVRGLGEERDGVVREYRGIAATALHILGKGEKIASRKKDHDTVRFLHEAISLLEMELPLNNDMAKGILVRGQKVLTALAATGDLTPKNREETELLEDPKRLAREVQELSLRFSRLSEEIDSTEEAVRCRPAIVKSHDLHKEAEDLVSCIGRDEERLAKVRAGCADLDRKLQGSFGDIRKRIKALSHGSIQLGEPEPAGR